MKKKCLLIAAALMMMSVASVNAQQVMLGVKGGLTVPNITPGGKDTPLSEGYSSSLAWGAGAFAEIKFSKLFSLQVGLEYSLQGGEKDGMQALPAGPIFGNMKAQLGAAAAPLVDQASRFLPNDYLYADFESKAKFNYIMLPVQAKFGWNLTKTSPVRVYVSAGLFAAYLCKAERVSKGNSPFYADDKGTTLSKYAMTNHGAAIGSIPPPTQQMIMGMIAGMDQPQDLNNTQNITGDINRFNFGFIGSVGFSYDITPKHRIFIEGGGNYGFLNIQKDEANGKNCIGAGSVMVGYGFTLGK